MRKVVVSEFVSLDGVMENPAWTFQFGTDEQNNFKFDELSNADALLLGRVTYEGFAAAWPGMAEETGEYGSWMNGYPKHVASTTLREPLEWNAALIGPDIAQEVRDLKQQDGKDVLVFGSATLVEYLVDHDLVDELRMMVYPIVVGKGRRLFERGVEDKALKLTDTQTFPTGVIALTYEPRRDE